MTNKTTPTREQFLARLEAIHWLSDALAVLASPPPIDTPARPLFSNFAFFWGHAHDGSGVEAFPFGVPAGATVRELRIYREILRRLDAAHALKPGALAPEMCIRDR